MLDFAMKVALRAHEIDDPDYARLREHGFSNESVISQTFAARSN
jgi:alkylhydroperoxidase family enzyme